LSVGVATLLRIGPITSGALMDAATRDLVRHLREHRLRAGLTQQEAAERLAELAWQLEHIHVGVNADMVSKWERGLKQPSKLYRRLFAAMYGLRPQPPAGTLPAQLLDSCSASLDRLGPQAELLRPMLLESWRDELVRRRSLLTLLGIAPLAGPAGELLDRLAATPAANPLPTGVDVVESLEALARRYVDVYHSADPEALMAPVAAHLRTVAGLLEDRARDPLRERLVRNQGEVALLAGRLAFFDLDDALTARSYYHLAVESAAEVADPLLDAVVLGHAAFLPAAERRFGTAASYLARGRAALPAAEGPLVRSWIAAVESEVASNAGDRQMASAALDTAERLAGEPGDGRAAPYWFDFYDATRLAGFRGYAALRFGRYEQAAAALEAAAAGLPARSVKQRAVVTADLAAVRVRQGEVDEGCRLAGWAHRSLRDAGYATGSGRLQDFRTLVRPWKDRPSVRLLEDQLATS
jgi:hypothetical protein